MVFGDIINGIPVLGHAKAAYHWLSFDSYEAGRAMKAATRTTAVMAGGAAGALVGGPAGMVGGAIGAGTAYDGVTSVVNKEAEGVFDGLKDVAIDIGNGNIPVKSVLKTGLYVGADAISGATGGSIAGNLPATMGKSLVKDAVVVVAKSTTQATCAAAAVGTTTRKIAKQIKPDEPSSSNASSSNTSSSNKSSSKTSSSNSTSNNSSTPTSGDGVSSGGGGQQPPQNNRNDTKTDHENEQIATESHFELLCRLFNAATIADIEIAGVQIFREITSGQPTDRARKNTLKKLIQALRDDGIVERVMETVKNIFVRLDKSEVTFQNFLNICEMVATYVSDKLARRHEMQASRDPRPRIPFNQRRAENLRAVLRDILSEPTQNILNIILGLYRNIKEVIKTMSPTFSSVFAAVYHYFKHKFVPFRFDVLTIQEYFALITSLMPRVRCSPQYQELLNGTRRRLVYDIYLTRFGRRVRIVLQVQNRIIVISSCHILEILIDGDDEGTEEYDRN